MKDSTRAVSRKSSRYAGTDTPSPKERTEPQMTTAAQRIAARQQMEEQRALATRLYAELENPTPLPPAVAAKVAAFTAWANGDSESADEQMNHFHQPKGYIANELDSLSDPDEDGHQIWTGPTSQLQPDIFAPKQHGIHTLCGKSHYQAARGLYEEFLGRALDENLEPVTRMCDELLCVAPAHHEVK